MNMLWYGGYAGSLENLTVIHPVPQLPNLYHLTFNDAPAYRGLIAEFDDAVMVVDSPPHQSKLTIQWVQQTLHRNVTHLLVSLNCLDMPTKTRPCLLISCFRSRTTITTTTTVRRTLSQLERRWSAQSATSTIGRAFLESSLPS
jgi:hypothetical protein